MSGRLRLGLVLAPLLWSCGDDGTAPAPDTTPPSTPVNVTAMAVSTTRIDVAWSPATDSVGVAGYKVFRDGIQFRILPDTQTADTGLTPGVLHCYAVSAYDSAGNESGHANQTCAATSNQAPIAAFTAPPTALTGALVTIDASGSHDPDGSIAQYRFDFGDGSPPVAQGTPAASHVYAAAGTYALALTVTDEFGAVGNRAGGITIGIELGTPVNISNTVTMSQRPSPARDETGAIDVVWEEYGDDIMFARSPAAGSAFSAPRYVLDPASYYGSSNFFGSSQMQVADAGGVIHVAWTIFDLLYGGAEVFYARSTDGGNVFSASPPALISTPDSVNSYGPAIAADAAGQVVVVWGESDLNTGHTAALASLSADTGKSFSTPVVLDSIGYCPVAALASGNVYAAWAQGYNLEELRFARSTNGGVSYSTPIAVDPGPSRSWCPRLLVDPAGTIYLLWEEGEAFTDRKVLLAKSTDFGVSFTPPLLLSTPTGDATCPAFARGDDGTLYFTWLQGDPLSQTARSVLAYSVDGGATLSPSLELPLATGLCPELLGDAAGHVGMVWIRTVGSTPDVFYQRAVVSIP